LDHHEPLIIHSGKQGEVVVIPEEDYENMKETIYILKDKVTMESLLKTRQELAQGTFTGIDFDAKG